MTLSLYDAVIPSNRQILQAVAGLIDKAAAFAQEKGIDAAALIDARLASDMLPLGYQVKSCANHAAGALAGVRAGSFSPSRGMWPTDFAGLRALVKEADATLAAVDPAEFDALAEQPMEFAMGDLRLPFTAAQFLLSFSQPNFYFHATTAYSILRKEGVKLGKTDFLGRLRLHRPG